MTTSKFLTETGSINYDEFKSVLKLIGVPYESDIEGEDDPCKLIIAISTLNLDADFLKSAWKHLHTPTLIKFQDEDVMMDIINSDTAKFIVYCKHDIISTLNHSEHGVRETALNFLSLLDYDDITVDIIDLLIGSLLEHFTRDSLTLEDKAIYELYLKDELSAHVTKLPVETIIKYMEYFTTSSIIPTLMHYPYTLLHVFNRINKVELMKFKLEIGIHELPYPDFIVKGVDTLLNSKSGDRLYLVQAIEQDTFSFIPKLFTSEDDARAEIFHLTTAINYNDKIKYAVISKIVGGGQDA